MTTEIFSISMLTILIYFQNISFCLFLHANQLNLQTLFIKKEEQKKMNTKVLVQTLIQIPDSELLSQLSASIHTHKAIMLPNQNNFFHMLSCIFSTQSKKLKLQALQLYRFTFTFLLRTQLEHSWNQVSTSMIRMVGEEDVEIRKKSKETIMEIIQLTNNANIVLQKLYYAGLEDESVLVIISSGKAIYTILQMYPNILHNKTSIRIVRLIIEKMIAFAMGSKHIEIEKNAKQFLEKLFYLKIQKLDQVLTLMNEKVLEYLQTLWMKSKQKMLQRQKQEDDQQLKKVIQIKYEHLTLINGKFFGVYEPYVLKNIFNPQIQAAKYLALTHFRQIFESHYEQLQKYMNVIFKVVMKFIEGEHYDLLMMLRKIVHTPGINNIVNLSVVPQVVVKQFETQNVPYRRELRAVLQKLNFQVPKQCLKAYQEQLVNTQINWIEMYEIVGLAQHWIDNNMESSYPPTLQKVLQALCHNLNSVEPKVKQKSSDVLLMILDRYPGYRENLQDHFSQQKISQIEDAIQKQKKKNKPPSSMSQQAEQIFRKEYEEQRQRFRKYKNITS